MRATGPGWDSARRFLVGLLFTELAAQWYAALERSPITRADRST
ncbi:MAG TPA: hypothetical protein VIH10_19430 [Kribbella sp.]